VPVQVIDVRDLSTFTIALIEAQAAGIFNATGPEYTLTFGAMLETCKQVSRSDATPRWASAEFLKQHNVQEWSDMPVWIPDTPETAGFSRVSIEKAINAGLTFRPLAETVRDTIAWANTRPADHVWRAGLQPEREQELLNLLNGR
jgi:2'-hydroxyisoflavone reductase